MNTDHEAFLVPFFKIMNATFPGKWCVLHSYETLPYYSESDVDMAFSHTDITRLEPLILKVGKDSGFQLHQKLWYDLQYCMYYVLKHRDKDIFLALDFLVDNAGVGKYGFKTNLLTYQCTKVKNLFPIPNPEIAFYYKLVKRIVKKRPLSEDENYLRNHYKSSDPEVILNYVTDEFGQEGKHLIIDFLKNEDKQLNNEEIGYLNTLRQQKKIKSRNSIAYAYWQAKRKINRVWHPGGAIVIVPQLPSDVLALFVDALRKKVDILFRFVELQASNSFKKNIKALAGSTLLIIPSQKYESKKAIKYKWVGTRYCGVEDEYDTNSTAVDQMVDAYYKAILKATNKRVLRRLSNGK